MSSAAPTFNHIKAKVAEIRRKFPESRVIGIRSTGRWTGDGSLIDGDQVYVVRQCDSPLAIRMALRQPVPDDAVKVLITDLDDQELSQEILLRLARRKLHAIEPWRIVQSLFAAQAVDPRLTRQAWIAEALLEIRPPFGYPAARGGFLDAETVWPFLLQHLLGMDADAIDPAALLTWSLDAARTARFRSSPPAFREGAGDWLTEKAGAVARIVLRCIERFDRPDAVPVGLAAAVIFHPEAVGKLERAAGKLEERFLGGEVPQTATMLSWSSAATAAFRTLRQKQPKVAHQVLQRADEILVELQADAYAHLSDTSLLGFDQRLARVGASLGTLQQTQAWDKIEPLERARAEANRHDQAMREASRLERAEMALRLVRWLAEHRRLGEFAPRSLAEAAADHLREGGFVDWARLSLRGGDPVRELSESYAKLFEEVTKLRERQSQIFAGLLADWTAAGSQGDDVVPVEKVLHQLVAPLAAEHLVLVVVVDGMSAAVCRELLADLTRHEWTPLCESGRKFNRPVLATIPSVTEFSRTSLLCGELRQGAMSDEKNGFSQHSALLIRGRSDQPPVLFHKAGLVDAGAEDAVLASEVREKIASSQRRVVGVVINAVDDHLLKGEQIDTHWSRDTIKVLPALMHEARMARRLVVLVSDHGHVLDCRTQFREGNGNERWRTASGEAAACESTVTGTRVLAPGGKLIAPWSERVRYISNKKNGYHGGINPQEMVIPLAVLASAEPFPAGWQPQPEDTPTWWDEIVTAQSTAERPIPPLKPPERIPRDTLFDLHAEDVAPTSSELGPPPYPVSPVAGQALPGIEFSDGKQLEPAASELPEWISRLLNSPLYAAQKPLVGRHAPSDHEIMATLAQLDSRGGKMTSVALARALNLAMLRIPGFLAKVQRLLNVDGYPVLSRDDVSDTVELNRDLLLKQFDLV